MICPRLPMTKKHLLRTHHSLALVALSLVAFACAVTTLGAKGPGATGQAPAKEVADHGAAVAKSIADLQPFREAVSNGFEAAGGMRESATLVNLNPVINARYLLTVRRPDGSESSYD